MIPIHGSVYYRGKCTECGYVDIEDVAIACWRCPQCGAYNDGYNMREVWTWRRWVREAQWQWRKVRKAWDRWRAR